MYFLTFSEVKSKSEKTHMLVLSPNIQLERQGKVTSTSCVCVQVFFFVFIVMCVLGQQGVCVWVKQALPLALNPWVENPTEVKSLKRVLLGFTCSEWMGFQLLIPISFICSYSASCLIMAPTSVLLTLWWFVVNMMHLPCLFMFLYHLKKKKIIGFDLTHILTPTVCCTSSCKNSKGGDCIDLKGTLWIEKK